MAAGAAVSVRKAADLKDLEGKARVIDEDAGIVFLIMDSSLGSMQQGK